VQGFNAVVKTPGRDTPGLESAAGSRQMPWGLPGFEYESAHEVLTAGRGAQDAAAEHVQGGS